jgi:hypothetical protein
MGSSGSKRLVASAGSSADQVFLTSATESVTEFRLNLPELFLLNLQAGAHLDFTIKNEAGDPWVRIAGGSDERMILSNAWTGETIAVIERRPWSSNFRKFSYRIFARIPNNPYQKSTTSLTTSDDLGYTARTPLYLFAKVFEDPDDEEFAQKRCCTSSDSMSWYKNKDKHSRSRSSWSYSRYNGNEGGPQVWTLNASGLDGKALVEIQPVDDEDKYLAVMEPSSYRTNEAGELTCDLLCAPGVDPVEAICVCVIMAMIGDDDNADDYGMVPLLAAKAAQDDSPARRAAASA